MSVHPPGTPWRTRHLGHVFRYTGWVISDRPQTSSIESFCTNRPGRVRENSPAAVDSYDNNAATREDSRGQIRGIRRLGKLLACWNLPWGCRIATIPMTCCYTQHFSSTLYLEPFNAFQRCLRLFCFGRFLDHAWREQTCRLILWIRQTNRLVGHTRLVSSNRSFPFITPDHSRSFIAACQA